MSFNEKDTQTDMLLGEPKSAICVQRFDDSLNSAIHTTYRSWLRSSSMREPRDPPSKVVTLLFSYVRTYLSHCTQSLHQMCPLKKHCRGRSPPRGSPAGGSSRCSPFNGTSRPLKSFSVGSHGSKHPTHSLTDSRPVEIGR